MPAIAQDTLRVATFNTGLKRAGPGLLLRDILKADDPQVLGARDVIISANPDILLLTRFDFDLGLRALTAFAELLRAKGASYPYRFAFAPNAGVATGFDLDRDGYLGSARDAMGYGRFAGNGGMAILSRFPIDGDAARNFSGFLWKDLPGSSWTEWPGADRSIGEIQRLSSVGHWDVPVTLPDGSTLRLLAYHATTPAFDGPDDRNGLRNYDETMFWLRYLEGALKMQPPTVQFVVLGDANLDPADGDGRQQAIRALLNSAFVQDAEPKSAEAVRASAVQGGVNNLQLGDPALDTADWKDLNGPGNLRVDYVLPSRDFMVLNAGVVWPAVIDPPEASGQRNPAVSRHGLVWVDLGR